MNAEAAIVPGARTAPGPAPAPPALWVVPPTPFFAGSMEHRAGYYRLDGASSRHQTGTIEHRTGPGLMTGWRKERMWRSGGQAGNSPGAGRPSPVPSPDPAQSCPAHLLLPAAVGNCGPPRVPGKENSSTTSTAAERPDPLAVQVCVVTWTTLSPQPSIRGLLTDRSQSDAKMAPIAATPSWPSCQPPCGSDAGCSMRISG